MARIRGQMKHPYRIKKSAPKEQRLRKELEKIDLLGDDELINSTKQNKKTKRVVAAEPQRGGLNKIQAQNFLKKIQEKRRPESLKNAQPQKILQKDPWSNDKITPQPLRSQNAILALQIRKNIQIHSASSYNPDLQLLKQIQSQQANIFLNSEIEQLKAQLNNSRRRRALQFRRLSEEAFLQLNSEQQVKIVYDETEENFELQKNAAQQKLIEMERLRQTVQENDEKTCFDDVEQRRRQIEEYVQALKQEALDLQKLYEEKKSVLQSVPAGKRDQYQAQLYADSLLEVQEMICENTNFVNQLQQELKHFQNCEIPSFGLPLENEISTLRAVRSQSALGDCYAVMRANAKFGALAEDVQQTHDYDGERRQYVVKTKSYAKVRAHEDFDKKYKQVQDDIAKNKQQNE